MQKAVVVAQARGCLRIEVAGFRRILRRYPLARLGPHALALRVPFHRRNLQLELICRGVVYRLALPLVERAPHTRDHLMRRESVRVRGSHNKDQRNEDAQPSRPEAQVGPRIKSTFRQPAFATRSINTRSLVRTALYHLEPCARSRGPRVVYPDPLYRWRSSPPAALTPVLPIQPRPPASKPRSALLMNAHLVNLRNDLRFAIRQLAKNPGFTFTAIVPSLPPRHGLAVAIFAFVDALLIRPLFPFASPPVSPEFTKPLRRSRAAISLTRISSIGAAATPFSNRSTRTRRTITPSPVHPDASSFESSASAPASSARVSPALGRDFREGEDQPSQPRTAILSYSAWQSKYAGRPDILGRTIAIEDGVWTIVGVLPRAFQFAPAGVADYWIPLRAIGGCELRRSCHNLFGVARLKDGVSLDAANSSIAALALQMQQELPASNSGQGGAVCAHRSRVAGDVRPVLTMPCRARVSCS